MGRKNSSYPTSLASLEEASEHLVTLHQLDVPATLSLSLLSTNAIENAMRNYRGQAAKVTHWLSATNQLSHNIHLIRRNDYHLAFETPKSELGLRMK